MLFRSQVKEQLVSLGEAILPVVTMMIEGFRSIVTFISDLPAPLKLATGAMLAFVAASGPIGQIALAVGGLLFVIGKLGEEGRKAKDRQADLTAEFVAAGDPAATMIDRMTALAASIEDVADEAEDATRPVGTFIGSNLALGQAMEKDLLSKFDDLGISMDDVAAAAEGGSDEFQRMERAFIGTNTAGESLRRNFDQLTEAERKVAEGLVSALEAGEITTAEFREMMDIVDETADAFDDNREMLEEQSKAFIQSADSVKLLNSANLDGEKILADFERQGMSYTEQARRIDIITREMTGSVDGFSVEAKRAGIETGTLADELDGAETPIEDVTEGMGLFEATMHNAAEEAKTLREAFEELMGTIVFEGEALNNAQLLMAEFDEVLANLGEKSVPELRQSFFDMATEAAGQLGELHDAGLALGSPEMIGAADAFLADLEAMGAAAGITDEELLRIKTAILEMSGSVIPIELQLQTRYLDDPTGLGEALRGFTPFAEGGIVTRPTMALIGEAGPEAVVPLSSASGASSVGAGGMSGGGSMTVNVNMPPGSDGADVVRALQTYARSHGGVVPILTGQL